MTRRLTTLLKKGEHMYINISDDVELSIQEGTLTIKSGITGLNLLTRELKTENKTSSILKTEPREVEDSVIKNMYASSTQLHRIYTDVKNNIVEKDDEGIDGYIDNGEKKDNEGSVNDSIKKNYEEDVILYVDENYIPPKTTNSKRVYLVHEHKELIRIINIYLKRNYTNGKIAFMLNEAGIKTSTNKKWTEATVNYARAVLRKYSLSEVENRHTSQNYGNQKSYTDDEYTDLRHIIVNCLSANYTFIEIAEVLNEKGLKTMKGGLWTVFNVGHVVRKLKLKSCIRNKMEDVIYNSTKKATEVFAN